MGLTGTHPRQEGRLPSVNPQGPVRAPTVPREPSSLTPGAVLFILGITRRHTHSRISLAERPSGGKDPSPWQEVPPPPSEPSPLHPTALTVSLEMLRTTHCTTSLLTSSPLHGHTPQRMGGSLQCKLRSAPPPRACLSTATSGQHPTDPVPTGLQVKLSTPHGAPLTLTHFPERTPHKAATHRVGLFDSNLETQKLKLQFLSRIFQVLNKPIRLEVTGHFHHPRTFYWTLAPESIPLALCMPGFPSLHPLWPPRHPGQAHAPVHT